MPRIRELEIFRIALPYGRRPETVLVKLTDYGGMVGWGEAVEPVTGEPLERSLPKLIGVDWEHPSEPGISPSSEGCSQSTPMSFGRERSSGSPVTGSTASPHPTMPP